MSEQKPVASKEELNKIAKALQDLWRVVKPTPCPSSYDAIWREYAAEIRRVVLSASALASLMEENAALAAHACIFLDGSGLTGDEHGNSICLMQRRAEAAEARAKAAEQRVKDMVKVLGKQIKALQPLSNAVFNDNGAITVAIPYITSEHCIEAYFTERAARDFIKEVGE
jgi:hypothetical protein